MLANFSGEDGDCFSHWEGQLKNFIAAYNLEDNNTRVLISCRFKGKALKWFHSWPDLMTVPPSQLIKEMGEMFVDHTSRVTRKRAFEARKWLTSETFQQYLHEKTIMANKISMEEEELLDCLINGIPDVNLRSQARMQRFRSKR